MIDFQNELKIALKTGKVKLGMRNALKEAKSGKVKLIVIAGDASENLRKDVSNYAQISGVPTYTYPGSAWNLGSACEKPFTVIALSVIDPGDSELLRITEET